MAFHDIRLPDDIEQGAQGGPGFLTTVIAAASGHEQRNQEWGTARLSWDIAYGIRNKIGYQTTVQFFYSRRGRLHSFRFKDWSDFEAVNQALGVGDGVATDFQLVKVYTDAGDTYTRTITRPVASTVVVRVDAVVATLTTEYTIEAGGIIRFTTGNEPAAAAVVTADFEFDVPVRFDVDKMAVALKWLDAGSIGSLNVIEILETPATIALEAAALTSYYDSGYAAGYTDGYVTGAAEGVMVPFNVDSGVVDALATTYSPAPVAAEGLLVSVRAAFTNTITAPTFEIVGTTSPEPIVKNGGAALAVGDILVNAHLYLSYHPSVPSWELINPVT